MKRILSAFLFLFIVIFTLSSCDNQDPLSKHLSQETKDKYGISDMPDIEGQYFERQGYSVNFKSTEDDFFQNAEMIYSYLDEKYPKTLCYVVNKEAGLFGATYTIAASNGLNSHFMQDGDSQSFVFVYALGDSLNENGCPKDPCKITLYFNDSEPDKELHRSYFETINDWAQYNITQQ